LRTAAALLFGAALLYPQGPPSQGGPPGGGRRGGGNFLVSRKVPDPAAVERGQKIFVANCGFCHGSNANGGESGPDLIRSPLALDDEGGDLIGPVIVKGRPDSGMPPFPAMTTEQIKDVSAFIRGRQIAAIDRRSYTIQNLTTGDPKKGEAFFNGAGQCKNCHSPTGDLAGIAKKFDEAGLQSRFLFPETRAGRGGPQPQRRLRPTVTVTLPSGAKVTGSLESIDDFDVALRDSSGEYHSFPRDGSVKVDVRDPLSAHEELLKKYTDAEMHNILAYLETLK